MRAQIERLMREISQLDNADVIDTFEDLMEFMHMVFRAIEQGISVDSLPKKKYDPATRDWALGIVQGMERRLGAGEKVSVAEISWALPLYHDEETHGKMPPLVRETIENFLELSRQNRLRFVESDELGGVLQIVPES